MKEKLLHIYQYFDQKPKALRIILIISILLSGGCLTALHFSEDITDFLSKSEDQRKVAEAYQHINTRNKILVSISAKDTSDGFRDSLIAIADEFIEDLKKQDTENLTSDIFFKVSDTEIAEMTDFIVQNLPYYMDEKDYQRLDSILIDESKMRNELTWNHEMLFTPTGAFLQNIILNDPVHISNHILKKLNGAYQENKFKQYNGYIFDHEGKELLITLTSETPSSETSRNQRWVNSIVNAKQDVMQKHKGEYEITHIGASVISLENANQIKEDTILSSSIALNFIAILLLLFYKDIRAIGLILFSILFGMLFAVGFLAISKESISFISIGIGSILVGIAVNYPLHFLAHLKEGHTREESIKEIASPLITGNITTVGAFLSLIFINSDAMKDMGLFASLLLIGTILFTLIFLPHLCKKTLFKKHKSDKLLFGKIANFQLEDHKWLVILVLLLTIPLVYFSTQTNFETDLHKINYMKPEQQEQLDKLIEETESKYHKTYCVCQGKTRDEALEKYESIRPVLDSLKHKGRIVQESGVSIFAPSLSLQKEKVERWNTYWDNYKEFFEDDLIEIGTEIGFEKSFFQSFINAIEDTIQVKDNSYFKPIQRALTDLYIYEDAEKAFVYTILETEDVNTVAIETTLNNIDPDIYTFDNQSFFTKMIESLSDDFNNVLFICAFIVFLFLTISFGRLELSLIAFIPLTIGWFWILGLMNLFDVRFNIVNIILATFIFGQGDDYTIFVTEGLMYEYTHKKRVIASYKNSVLLSACIMFIGIGALIVAKHPAMKSLAEVTIVGMSSVILMACLFPPLLYKWLTTIKGKARLMPITFRNLGSTIISFIVFFIGSIFLTLFGFFLLTIGGKSESHKLTYHKMLCKTFRALAKAIPNIDYHISGLENNDFEKPSILICNHQSHLDLMYTLLLHPKIICLTNQWVWNCPFYKWIIRYADFYPITDGVENSIDRLKSVIDRGYSILIFPEGTRSEDCSILRFHQGAFYLAEKFRVNVVPILIHGVGHVFPKSEFLLRKGRVDIKVLPSITPESEFRGILEPKRSAQLVRHYYEDEYAKLVKEVETVDYFKDLVYHNYIYKGRDIAREAKRNLKQEGLTEWVNSLPESGEYTITNCGQGEKSLIAALVKKDLHIIATDKDKDKISIAQHCTSVPQNLEYRVEENPQDTSKERKEEKEVGKKEEKRSIIETNFSDDKSQAEEKDQKFETKTKTQAAKPTEKKKNGKSSKKGAKKKSRHK